MTSCEKFQLARELWLVTPASCNIANRALLFRRGLNRGHSGKVMFMHSMQYTQKNISIGQTLADDKGALYKGTLLPSPMEGLRLEQERGRHTVDGRDPAPH